MIHEHFSGAVREVRWGELQDLAGQAANVLASLGVARGDRVAVVLPPTPETAAVFFATWKLGALLLSMSVLYGDDGIRHRLGDSRPRVLVTDRGERGAASRPIWRPRSCSCSTSTPSTACRSSSTTLDTAADDPAQLYYTSGTTGLAKGIVHAHRYLLGHEEFHYCHDVQPGERFHGMGEWAWAAGIAPLLGPWRLGAVQCVYQREGGFDPHRQLDFLSRHEVTNVFATPTAIRSMMSIGDARTRYPQRFRIVCSAGEPLNPEAIRWFREQYGVTVLDYYGLTESYPLCGNFPFMEVREGSMGRPMPGWDVAILDADEQPVAAASAARSACARARTRTTRSATGELPEASEETFGGEWFHTKDAARMDEDGYVWYEGRADDVIISAGYRIGPFEVESACLEHPAVAEAAVVASPDERRGNVVKAFVVLAAGHEPSDELAERDQGLRSRAAVRLRVSAPRRVRRRACRRRSPARSAASSCGSARQRRAPNALRSPSGRSPTRPGRLERPAGQRTGSGRWPVPVVGSVMPPRPRHEVLGRCSSAVICDRAEPGEPRARPAACPAALDSRDMQLFVRTAAVALVTALVLAGCGGGSHHTRTTSSSTAGASVPTTATLTATRRLRRRRRSRRRRPRRPARPRRRRGPRGRGRPPRGRRPRGRPPRGRRPRATLDDAPRPGGTGVRAGRRAPSSATTSCQRVVEQSADLTNDEKAQLEQLCRFAWNGNRSGVAKAKRTLCVTIVADSGLVGPTAAAEIASCEQSGQPAQPIPAGGIPPSASFALR